MDVEQRALKLMRDICALPLNVGAEAEIALICDAIRPPEGFVLVPVGLVEAIKDLALIYEAGGDIDRKLCEVEGLLDASLGAKP